MSIANELAQEGFVIAQAVFSPTQLHELASVLHPLHQQHGQRALLLQIPALRQHLLNENFRALLQQLNLQRATIVRSLYFDKSLTQNWLVPWHQDRVIAVRESAACEGFQHWTKKDGCWHVEPPLTILQGITVIRIAVDAATENSGALWVLPRSHLSGAVMERDITAHTAAQTAVRCDMKAGDVLVMNQLLLHRSDKSQCATPRRVIHLEYSDAQLPFPLHWAEQH